MKCFLRKPFFFLLFVAVVVVVRAKETVEEVFSVVGASAALPCDIKPAAEEGESGDGPRLVLWYKDDSPHPVYSWDARFDHFKRWSEDKDFGPRAYFR